MAIAPDAHRAEQLQIEQQLLLKAEADIEAGWRRVRSQEGLVSELRASGYDTKDGERLTGLLLQMRVEWERHRTLIEQRIAYLRTPQGQVLRPGRLNSAPISNM
jgi:hypothetical protein